MDSFRKPLSPSRLTEIEALATSDLPRGVAIMELLAEVRRLNEAATPFDEPGQRLRDIERRVILARMSRLNNRRDAVAKSLAIGVRTLSDKLRSYGVPAYGKVPTSPDVIRFPSVEPPAESAVAA